MSVRERRKRRSLDANAQVHVWFQQIANETGDDVLTVKARCKRDFGLPIIFSDVEVGVPISWMLESCGFWQLSDARQCKIMRGISVTSLMSTAQCNEFRDAMRAGFLEQGIDLRYVGEPPAI